MNEVDSNDKFYLQSEVLSKILNTKETVFIKEDVDSCSYCEMNMLIHYSGSEKK